MIQRVQTIWLLLAAVCGFALTQVSLFTGRLPNEIIRRVLATESLLLFALIIGAACLALACIFLFKNRPLQFKLSVTGVVLSIIITGLEVWYIEGFKRANTLVKGTYYWGGLLPIAMVILFILATRGIYKDEKVIKSLNRLR